jgi:hypothetical protein
VTGPPPRSVPVSNRTASRATDSQIEPELIAPQATAPEGASLARSVPGGDAAGPAVGWPSDPTGFEAPFDAAEPDAGPPDSLFDVDPESIPPEVATAVGSAPATRGAADLQSLIERIERIFPGRTLGFVPASVDAEEDAHVALSPEPLAVDDEPDLGGSA